MQVREPFDLLPLRQLVSATGGGDRVFAQQVLLDQLSRPGRFRIVRHGSGAEVLAANERALAEARSRSRKTGRRRRSDSATVSGRSTRLHARSS